MVERNDAKIGAQGKELQSNVTDNDSAKMKTSHGNHSRLQWPGVGGWKTPRWLCMQRLLAAGPRRPAPGTAMVDGAKDNLENIGESEDYFEDKVFTADSNYHNQSTLEKCQEEKLDAYIPDLKFRSRDCRFATRPRNKPKKDKKFVLQDFKYDEAADCYICPNWQDFEIRTPSTSTIATCTRRYSGQCARLQTVFIKKQMLLPAKTPKRRSLDVPHRCASNQFFQSHAAQGRQ